MNRYLCAAAILAAVVGLVHSVLGEVLVFSRMRDGRFVPTNGAPVLQERHVRIVWASWHVLTAFGWAFAAMLWVFAGEPALGDAQRRLLEVVIVAMAAGAALVFYGTRARHPGWAGLLGVAVLTWAGIG